MKTLESHNHWKGLIQFQFIFSTKYRRNVFNNESIRNEIKNLMLKCAKNKNFEIVTQEIDIRKPNHCHGLIKYTNFISPNMIVNALKSYTTFHIWQKHPSYMQQFYRKKCNLWTRGYFCSSICNANPNTIKQYIENQG